MKYRYTYYACDSIGRFYKGVTKNSHSSMFDAIKDEISYNFNVILKCEVLNFDEINKKVKKDFKNKQDENK